MHSRIVFGIMTALLLSYTLCAQDSIARFAAARHDSALVRTIDSLQKINASLQQAPTHKGADPPSKIPWQDRLQKIWPFLPGILLILLIFYRIKLHKMAADDKLRRQMIDQYSESVDKLHTYLKEKLRFHEEDFRMAGLNKKMEIIKGKITELVDKYLNEDQRSQQIGGDLDSLKDQLKAAHLEKNALTQQLQGKEGQQFIPYVTNLPHTYITAEILTSAGPRKEATNSDTELGEDVAGAISLPDETFFWLLDGTSDSAAINEGVPGSEASHVFSSRLLAQNLSFFIQKHIASCLADRLPLEDLLQRAREHVQQEWTSRLNQLLPEKKAEVIRLLDQRFKPLCSTTVIIGRLMKDGHLYALRSGDSKIFPFVRDRTGSLTLADNYHFAEDPADDYDRIAFRLDYDAASDKFVIKSNIPRWLTTTIQHISAVFIFTDGIGRVVESQLANRSPGIVDIIRQNISRIPQKTYDDKTLIILERITTP